MQCKNSADHVIFICYFNLLIPGYTFLGGFGESGGPTEGGWEWDWNTPPPNWGLQNDVKVF